MTAVTVNLLNPHPYLFWGVALGPTLVSLWQSDPVHAAAFVFGFYFVMIGLFAGWIILFGSAARLPEAVRRIFPVAAGLVLGGFGLLQIFEGLRTVLS